MGLTVSKFNGVTMLGGVQLNGQQIYTELLLSDLEKLETEMRTTYELNQLIMIGNTMPVNHYFQASNGISVRQLKKDFMKI